MFGRYAIVRRIGKGGMGAVFLATDQRTGGQVQMSQRTASLLMFLSVMMIVLMFWVLIRLGGA